MGLACREKIFMTVQKSGKFIFFQLHNLYTHFKIIMSVMKLG